MKNFILGVTFLFLLAVFPISSFVNYVHQDSVAMTVRFLDNTGVVDRREIGDALQISEEELRGGINHAIARRMMPAENLTWKWVGLPAVIFVLVNAGMGFKGAYATDSRTNPQAGNCE